MKQPSVSIIGFGPLWNWHVSNIFWLSFRYIEMCTCIKWYPLAPWFLQIYECCVIHHRGQTSPWHCRTTILGVSRSFVQLVSCSLLCGWLVPSCALERSGCWGWVTPESWIGLFFLQVWIHPRIDGTIRRNTQLMVETCQKPGFPINQSIESWRNTVPDHDSEHAKLGRFSGCIFVAPIVDMAVCAPSLLYVF